MQVQQTEVSPIYKNIGLICHYLFCIICTDNPEPSSVIDIFE